MITEFLWLTALTLNKDEKEALRGEINEWMKLFLPKLERESTRTEKCRLVASVERHQFGNDENAGYWRFCKFVGKKGIIFRENQTQLEEFEATSFQKKILDRNPNLSNVFIGRSEIKEENGKWKLENELKERIISEGVEAIVFREKFGKDEMAVRIQIFDPFLFSQKFGADLIKFKTHLISDFGKATDYEYRKDQKNNEASVVPIHENIVRHFANIEIFDSGDKNEEDCLGWITIMEKCDGNLRTKLENDNLELEERKKIAKGLKSGFEYLKKIGIFHKDRKLENLLMIGEVAKICDFGVVSEYSGRKSYRNLGYSKRGSKYRNEGALFAGTPGFAGQFQIGGVSLDDTDCIFYICFAIGKLAGL
ncbi:unnamed protein product [Oikopleura dioica]|uniref:Protein kinase domain-containing protein n=1 Tax=Oikopleura dioica TaxID=34765 RepID=E4Y1E6_OIKDI|nr:unnamed protein product [Oikopleura dioica]